jgi:plastocyanin
MLAGIAAVVTSLALAACGGDEPEAETGSAPAAEQGDQSTVITISDFTYQVPETLEPGATITVRNEDGVGHTVTSDDGAFDVAVGPGEEATLTVPEEPGEYPFHCTPHPQMTSTLVVG